MDGVAIALFLIFFALLFALFVVIGVAIWVLVNRRRKRHSNSESGIQDPDSPQL